METVEIVEVGPRDGLQNEPRLVPLQEKLALIDLLSTVGFRRIEAASFVSARRVPQMADATAVMAGIVRVPGVRYAALAPNRQGAEVAIAARCDEIAVFASASEGFSRANLNCSVDESVARFGPVAELARAAGIPLRGYVSCATDCPFDGAVAPERVARVAAMLRDLGCHEVSLADTLGRAHPEAVDAMLASVLEELPPGQLAAHFHDTGGGALANIDVALARGLRVFDAAVGGLGGCPFAPGAPGNVATEAVHDHLVAAGYATGLNRDILLQASGMARALRIG
ncbi:hydroxymethylglutaryl-CoA lyase [Halodurantibacterium flavum]|uniref:Hydroxymethylglutaryl-CoA lyase n=1 Tax=Halodurantibacterium flavum TaxID=1382802 RepID=A0ABW4S8L7_9RHOB